MYLLGGDHHVAMGDLNIYFLAVARVQGEGIVVASHSNDSSVELSGVTQVIEQPTMSMQPGKHYSFDVGKSSGGQTWHLISGRSFSSLGFSVCIVQDLGRLLLRESILSSQNSGGI